MPRTDHDLFELNLDCYNAAFDPDRNEEIARILEATAARLRAGITAGSCYDANGNNVGSFAVAQ